MKERHLKRCLDIVAKWRNRAVFLISVVFCPVILRIRKEFKERKKYKERKSPQGNFKHYKTNREILMLTEKLKTITS